MNRILKGQMGVFEDGYGSTVYGVKGQQDFIDDCVTLGFEYKVSEDYVQAYTSDGKITGDFCRKTGGMIAFSI